jgi:hypothetical protein
MKKLVAGLTVTLLTLFASSTVSAAFVTDTDDGALTISGGSTFTTSSANYPGGFPDGNHVFGVMAGFTGATLLFNLNTEYEFEYMGKEAGDTNTFAFASGSYSSFDTSSSLIGDDIVVGAADLVSWVFDGNNSNPATNPSPNIFMAALGNYVWLGFDDREGGHVDYDDLVVRVSAVSTVPVPAAIWLFGTALIGFVGFSRRTVVT